MTKDEKIEHYMRIIKTAPDREEAVRNQLQLLEETEIDRRIQAMQTMHPCVDSWRRSVSTL